LLRSRPVCLPTPDGCATFFRTDRCHLLAERRLLYADGLGGANSGHVGQVQTIEVAGVRLDLVNTHLKWDPPGTPRDRQWGYRQASLALSALPAPTPSGIQVICGDFNVTTDSPVIRLLTSAGFDYVRPPGPGIYTCNSSREAKLIDYLFFRGAVRVEPVALPVIDGETPLPSASEPSDHLPLRARFIAEAL
jgi:endonuclease/exonuclease/phosphatase family metal-dependent hydrolase